MTRAELLRHALSRALRKMHAGRQKLRLDEETRWQIAGESFQIFVLSDAHSVSIQWPTLAMIAITATIRIASSTIYRFSFI